MSCSVKASRAINWTVFKVPHKILALVKSLLKSFGCERSGLGCLAIHHTPVTFHSDRLSWFSWGKDPARGTGDLKEEGGGKQGRLSWA